MIKKPSIFDGSIESILGSAKEDDELTYYSPSPRHEPFPSWLDLSSTKPKEFHAISGSTYTARRMGKSVLPGLIAASSAEASAVIMRSECSVRNAGGEIEVTLNLITDKGSAELLRKICECGGRVKFRHDAALTGGEFTTMIFDEACDDPGSPLSEKDDDLCVPHGDNAGIW